MRPLDPPISVILGNHDRVSATQIGDVLADTPFGSLVLKDVLYIPKLKTNLFSTGVAIDDGSCLNFTGDRVFVRKDSKKIASATRRSRGLWHMDFIVPECLQPSAVSSSHLRSTVDVELNLARSVKAPLHIWHARLGHAAYSTVFKVAKSNCVTGFSCSGDIKPPLTPCEPCVFGKKTFASFQQSFERASRPAELVHFDTFSALSPSLRGSRYGLLLVDDYSSTLFRRVSPLVVGS